MRSLSSRNSVVPEFNRKGAMTETERPLLLWYDHHAGRPVLVAHLDASTP